MTNLFHANPPAIKRTTRSVAALAALTTVGDAMFPELVGITRDRDALENHEINALGTRCLR